VNYPVGITAVVKTGGDLRKTPYPYSKSNIVRPVTSGETITVYQLDPNGWLNVSADLDVKQGWVLRSNVTFLNLAVAANSTAVFMGPDVNAVKLQDAPKGQFFRINLIAGLNEPVTAGEFTEITRDDGTVAYVRTVDLKRIQ
ncbi:MAG: hypothetical protein ACRC5C_14730, partial [Bacilli bacterium]